MHKYKIEVLNDENNTTHVFEIASPIKIDSRVLQIVGLWLDDGASKEIVESELALSQSFVSVTPSHQQDWVDTMLGVEEKEAPPEDVYYSKEEALKIVEEHIVVHDQYRVITKEDCLKLLGSYRFEILAKDRMRSGGPTPDTFYYWNVVDYLCNKGLVV